MGYTHISGQGEEHSPPDFIAADRERRIFIREMPAGEFSTGISFAVVIEILPIRITGPIAAPMENYGS
jgi:hypothetical protein